MFKKVLVSATLTLCAFAAFAMPKPSEVKAAFAAGDYVKAESLLKEVIKEKPALAAPHYQLGQVYAKEGKHSEALNELRQAQVLDPSLKFASSAAEFTKNLNNEQILVAPPVTVSQNRSPYTASGYAVVPAAVAEPPTESHAGTWIIVMLLIIVAIVSAIFFFRQRTSDEINKAHETDKTNKMNTLVDLIKKLQDSLLISKTASYDDTMKSEIESRIRNLIVQIRGAISDLKDNLLVSSARIEVLRSGADLAAQDAANGITIPPVVPRSPPPVVAPLVKPVVPVEPIIPTEPMAPRANGFTPPYPMPAAPASYPSVVHHYHETPAPVIVQNSGNDMLTGVLLGEMLSQHNDSDSRQRERDRQEEARQEREEERARERREDDRREQERETQREQARLDAQQTRDDTYSTPDTLDTGSSSNDSYDSSSDSSSSSSSDDNY